MLTKQFFSILSHFILFFLIIVRLSASDVFQTGLDVLIESDFRIIENKNIGIICNHTSCDKDGNHIVDLIFNHQKCNVKAIFAPEHGFRGNKSAGVKINTNIDSTTGSPVYSLYGKIKKPTKEMLKNIDVLLYDIQDIGARFYTYISTMTMAMKAAAENRIPIIILDRPNPIRGDIVQGGIRQFGYESFVGMHPTPIRYGMTCGELANYINDEILHQENLSCDLHIVKLQNWNRSLWYDEIEIPWIAPSPNMTNIETAIVYPGFCMFEGTNISEGRGTTEPFLRFGAPWIDSNLLLEKIQKLNLKGVKFSKSDFTPISIPGRAVKPKYQNQKCGGIKIRITDRNTFNSIKSFVYIIEIIYSMYPKEFKWNDRWIDLLSGSNQLRNTINGGSSIKKLLDQWEKESNSFGKVSKQYYLY